MNKILALSILVFSVIFVACSGDGNPSAGRFDNDSVTPPSVVNDPADIQEAVEEAVKEGDRKVNTSNDDDYRSSNDDDDDDYGDYDYGDYDYEDLLEYFK